MPPLCQARPRLGASETPLGPRLPQGPQLPLARARAGGRGRGQQGSCCRDKPPPRQVGSPPPAGCVRAARSGRWPRCFRSLGRDGAGRADEAPPPRPAPAPAPAEGPLGSPRGTTMSARRMVGWMYWSKAGFTNLLYCLMTPSMSRPRSLMSRRSRRTRRMSESVSTKIFMSRSWRGRARSQGPGASGARVGPETASCREGWAPRRSAAGPVRTAGGRAPWAPAPAQEQHRLQGGGERGLGRGGSVPPEQLPRDSLGTGCPAASADAGGWLPAGQDPHVHPYQGTHSHRPHSDLNELVGPGEWPPRPRCTWGECDSGGREGPPHRTQGLGLGRGRGTGDGGRSKPVLQGDQRAWHPSSPPAGSCQQRP